MSERSRGLSNRRFTVLLTAVGRRVELIECFRRDARLLGVEIRIVAAEARPETSAACHFADRVHRVPGSSDRGYVEALSAICCSESVDLLIPLLDPELSLIAAARAAFEKEGTFVAISNTACTEICGNKLSTARCMKESGIPVPRTEPFTHLLENEQGWSWPVMAKPVCGSASRGVHLLRNADAARGLEIEASDYVAQEFLEGTEYTVNVYFDRAGRMRCAVPHQRLEVRAGEVSKARTHRLPALQGIARSLESALPGAAGPMCFQAMVTPDGMARVFEINARFGGGYPLAHEAGARFPLWLMQERLGLAPDFDDVAWADGLVMLRYDQSVFIPPSEDGKVPSGSVAGTRPSNRGCVGPD